MFIQIMVCLGWQGGQFLLPLPLNGSASPRKCFSIPSPTPFLKQPAPSHLIRKFSFVPLNIFSPADSTMGVLGLNNRGLLHEVITDFIYVHLLPFTRLLINVLLYLIYGVKHFQGEAEPFKGGGGIYRLRGM